jgi:CO dehydrogenase maturation factor
MKIAISGKGGTGKTFIAGSLACAFSQDGYRTLALDADTSPNLGLTLGLSTDELRSITPLSENGDIIGAKTGTDYPGVYRLSFGVDDIVRDAVIPTPAGPGLIVMGTVRSMGSGCSCPAHSLVREVMRHLLVDRAEVVIMDMEAGVEHLGRGTAGSVDMMLVITDATVRSLDAARSIVCLARQGDIPVLGLVGNRVRDVRQEEIIRDAARRMAIPVEGMIPYDQTVADAEVDNPGTSVFHDSPSRKEVERIRKRLLDKPRKDDPFAKGG